jgi:DNA-binding LytR/AlgR family response regulator
MIKCIAVDDSPLALDLLDDYAKRTGILSLEHKCTNALEAAKILSKGKYDLVFLDIQMPDFSGIDLAKNIRKPTKVIFTTAYPDYAVEGFNLDAADYLLKPFSFARFSKAVSKVAEQLKKEKLSQQAPLEADKFIYVRSGYDTIRILLRDIDYIEAMKDYIQVFTAHGKIMSLISMKDMLSVLPCEEFVRVHRSFIVPLSKISKVSPKRIFVGKKEIPLGDVYRPSFQVQMAKRTG